MSSQSKVRIAIVDSERCQPTKCKQECKRICPVNRIGKQCVDIVGLTPKLHNNLNNQEEKIKPVSTIVESMCIGCGQCAQKCPFKAIQIINLPSALNQIIYRYGPNQFQLHSLPMPRRGIILGLIGANGCGKTTSLQVLCKQIKPNFGELKESSDADIIKFYRGSSLQNYFNELYKKSLTISFKPQHVRPSDAMAKQTVKAVLSQTNTLSLEEYTMVEEALSLREMGEKTVGVLSGGMCQRLFIALTLIKEADVYIFDEPSSFLDIKQRMNMASIIRELLVKKKNKYVIVVEHDLSVLDYLSDQMCLLYGQAGAYGIASAPYSVGEGINMYLDGFIKAENTRFRPEGLNFKFGEREQIRASIASSSAAESSSGPGEVVYTDTEIQYPELRKAFEGFQLTVGTGQVKSSEICVLVGSNGTGKTTFIKMLCGLEKPEDGITVPLLNVSYKPQIIKPKFEGTVQELFYEKIGSMFTNAQFQSDVVRPLHVDHLMDQKVLNLSGGQLQTVSIILALGKPADVYLIDEPSAYLDIEQRLAVAKVIKRFIMNTHKYCFVVEHDFIMSTYMADQVIVFSHENGAQSVASSPMPSSEGFNQFLKLVNVTFRRDRLTYRPRINKPNSQTDQQQKASGQYYQFSDHTETVKSYQVEGTQPSDLEW
jgi:ATP-binding cassette subfamily E protein 1